MKAKILYIALTLILLFPLSLQAQQFSISNFRVIYNDMTAFHTPVYDLNHDACALVKVVCSSDYVFDSPLGIVKRVDEVGEVWLYLPQGSILLTIRHPQWGVLRDYRFSEELEANITYELVIASPQIVEVVSPQTEEQTLEQPIVNETIPTQPTSQGDIIQEVPPISIPQAIDTYYFALPTLGIATKTISYGIRVGKVRRHGIYLMALSDFKSTPSSDGECDSSGALTNGTGTPYYSGDIKRSLINVMAGGVHRIVGGLYLYEGIGYGNYSVVWGTSNEKYYKNKYDSAIGVSAEVGALYRIGKVAFSAGGSTIMAKHWGINVGIGFCF